MLSIKTDSWLDPVLGAPLDDWAQAHSHWACRAGKARTCPAIRMALHAPFPAGQACPRDIPQQVAHIACAWRS